jgi:hypothetical protein
MTKTEAIKVQDGDTIIELTGEAKAEFIAQREEDSVQFSLREAEYQAKRNARESALTKLGEIAGLTKEELDAIL